MDFIYPSKFPEISCLNAAWDSLKWSHMYATSRSVRGNIESKSSLEAENKETSKSDYRCTWLTT